MNNEKQTTELLGAVWKRVMALPVEFHKPLHGKSRATQNAAVSALIQTLVAESISTADGHLNPRDMNTSIDHIVGKIDLFLDDDEHVYTYDEAQGGYQLDLS